MAKIVDSFLFFQELDLLEIRLEYLYEKVDKFIILESCQTFTGQAKPFNFEANIHRFEKYLDKIIYHKIEDSHDSYQSVIDYLASKNDHAHQRVLNMMESHTHYPKDGLHWVLDTYHRESLHLAYNNYLDDDDILFLSDLDEIPAISIFDNLNNLSLAKPRVCKQHEFMYFLNYYNNSNWFGTIFGKFIDFKDLSLCTLRMDSKETRNIVTKQEYINGGYHFTSIGDIETIKKKIQSWGHQEYNTQDILDRLEYNIATGQDIFEREYGSKMIKIEFSNKDIFDEKIGSILSKYNDLITKSVVKFVSKYNYYNIYRKVKSKINSLLQKVDCK